MLRFDDAARTLELGVSDLLDARPPAGDLALPLVWSAQARMRAGQQVHSDWQASRASADPSFAREVSVRTTFVVRGWEVTLFGRLDGLSWEDETAVVEEVKSTAMPSDRLDAASLADFPDWARQLQLYLFMLAAQGVAAVGRLVLVSLFDGAWRVLGVSVDPSLEEDLRAWLDWILAQREARLAWLAQRRAATVPFAWPEFRPGQQALCEALAGGLRRGEHLLLSAPTGLGKTAAALYAAIGVAWATDRRVFFATARTPQQRLAEETLRAMAAAGLPVRAVSLRARDKVCQNGVVACRADACRFASAYHDKLRAAGLPEALWAEPLPAVEAVVLTGQQREVCPFALSMDLAAQADVVIGDYNYVFDPGAKNSRLWAEGLDQWIVVVDEAHNLPERAMGYVSPSIDRATAEAAADLLEGDDSATPFLSLALEAAVWLAEGFEAAGAGDPEAWGGDPDVAWGEGEVSVPLDSAIRRRARELGEQVDALALPYALRRLSQGGAGAGLAGEDAFQRLARALLKLRGAVDRAGDETVAIWRADGTLSLLCRDSAPVIGPVFEGLAASLCMSATLSPSQFYQDLFGLQQERVKVHAVDSPFPPEHRRVLIVPSVSTAWRHRARDRDATAAIITAVLDAVPGNVAVYFSSFAFRDAVAPLVETGERTVLSQGRAMDEAARDEILNELAKGEDHVLMGVLGGIFAEGVDLPGRALLAAVVVGPALPAVGLERALMQRWYEDRYGAGFAYAYLVPGMAKVVQAAGRVIRTAEDRGAVVLVDQRFLRHEYQAYFPFDWAPERTKKPGEALAGLWDAPRSED